MIFDKLENLEKYNLSFIKKYLEKDYSFSIGKKIIDSDNTFVISMEYITKLPDRQVWEAHRKYLDIHIVAEGEEIVFVSDIENMDSIKEYVEDYELFDGKKQVELVLKPGYFLALYPHEAHKTGITTSTPSENKKLVFKLLL